MTCVFNKAIRNDVCEAQGLQKWCFHKDLRIHVAVSSGRWQSCLCFIRPSEIIHAYDKAISNHACV